MPPWLTKTLIVVHLNPEMPLNMARDFVAKLHHHAPLYNERAQGYTSVWRSPVCVYRQSRFVNKLSKCSFYFLFSGFREFRIFETHYFYNTRLDPDFFFIWVCREGVQGVFSEILLCKFKKSRTAHWMTEPYILGVMLCFVSLKMLPVSHTVNIHEN